ncbi:DUF6894 family protein [Belnapia mucosa]|uniref:DUF6894 family protein n=1 Tax=Belnapia mucosa TaxID=2804532 RepID=UPI0038B3FE02
MVSAVLLYDSGLPHRRGRYFDVDTSGSQASLSGQAQKMPRYFWTLHDGANHYEDDEGVEIACIEDVQAEAMQFLPEYAKNIPSTLGAQTLVANVRDEAGRLVLQATMSLSCRILRWANAASPTIEVSLSGPKHLRGGEP